MSAAATFGDVVAAKHALTFQRRRQAAAQSRLASLGGRWVGQGSRQALQAVLLASAAPVFDGWGTPAQAHEQRQGCVHYATDGHWLHGCAEIDDAVDGLQAAARRAYADVFAVLAASRSPHLLRLWNYFAGINLETDGVERYRQFNAGRQQAFIDARRSAFEGAPAACALGTQGGPLRVYFLAGRTPPVAVENPRQVSAYRYPEHYGERRPTFSRAAVADAGGGRSALFISGTASIVGHASVHADDVRRQTEETMRNIESVCAAAAARTGVVLGAADLTHTVYLRHPTDLAIVREEFERVVGAASAAAREAVYLQADICRADLLVEIEAHGFARTGGER